MPIWGQVVSLASSCLPNLSTPHITVKDIQPFREGTTPGPGTGYTVYLLVVLHPAGLYVGYLNPTLSHP